jgi:hypothetical protein
MRNTVFCTCGKEVQIRTDKRIAKHVSGERLRRGLIVLDRCKMSGLKLDWKSPWRAFLWQVAI